MTTPKYKSGECVKCGIWRQSLHRDHIIPKFKGGTDDHLNIQRLCANCHEDKTREDEKDPEYRALQSAGLAKRRAGMMGPKYQQNAKAAAKLRWKDPLFRAAVLGALHSPETKAKQLAAIQRKREERMEALRAEVAAAESEAAALMDDKIIT